MTLVLYFLVAFFPLRKVLAAPFSDGQVQPGIYPAPALPSNFTKNADFWRSPAAAAPKSDPGDFGGSWSRSVRKEISNEKRPRQSGNLWNGWQNVRYLFTLYVAHRGYNIHKSRINATIAATHTLALASITMGYNQTLATRLAIQPTQVLHPRTVQTTLIS